MSIFQCDNGESAELNYQQVENYLKPFLQQIGMNSSLIEAHAIFCGILCVSPAPDDKVNLGNCLWFNLLDLQIDEQNALSMEAKEQVDLFYRYVHDRLTSDLMDFALPIDDTAILLDKIDDFSTWIDSFLYGLVLNPKCSVDDSDPKIREFLSDLTKIERVQEYELGQEEDNEADLFELMEYVRMGVLYLFDSVHLQKKVDSVRKKQTGLSDPSQLFH